jgi:hypothetical protein
MRMLGIAELVLLACLAGNLALADDAPSPEALAAAQELLAVLSPDFAKQLTNNMDAIFWPVVEQRAHAAKIDDATIAEMRSEFDRIQIAFVTEALKQAPPIYARHFTITELHEMTAYYRSPTGAKALKEMPQVMGEVTSQLMRPQSQDLEQRINNAFSKVLHEHGFQR